MKKQLLKYLIIIVIILFFVGWLILVKVDKNTDTIKYNGKNYVLLEYNSDIFTYNFNSNNYYEEDIIHPVIHNIWDAVYFNGDIFILDEQVDLATKYYLDDKNYNWFIVYEKEESEVKVPISISKDELEYLYNIENVKKKDTMIFDDIKQFVDIVKISNDDFLMASINLVYCDDSLYWKSEIMNDNDEEYIISIPDSLSDKIFYLLQN